MAEGQVLGHEGGLRTKNGAERAESESNEAEHRERIRSESESPRRTWDWPEVQRFEASMARPQTPLWDFGEAQDWSRAGTKLSVRRFAHRKENHLFPVLASRCEEPPRGRRGARVNRSCCAFAGKEDGSPG